MGEYFVWQYTKDRKMSRTSSTFGKNSTLRSSLKMSGAGHISGVSSDGEPTMSSSIKRPGSRGTLKAGTGALVANFSNSLSSSGTLTKSNGTVFDRIESEYIKNLQQQIYFLELEANFLREQVANTNELRPKMSAAAEQMTRKMKELQSELDSQSNNLLKNQTLLESITNEKDQALRRLKSEQDSHNKEKKLLLEEVVQIRKELELHQHQLGQKETQLNHAKDDIERGARSLADAETKIQILSNQLDQKNQQLKLMESTIDSKRHDVQKLETQLRDVEDKYYDSTVVLREKASEELTSEVRELKHKLREIELMSEQDRYLKSKLSEDNSKLARENATLNQQVTDLQKQVDQDKILREAQESRRQQTIAELVALKDKESSVRNELQQTKAILEKEQEKNTHYVSQITKQGQMHTSQELNASTIRSRLAELEGIHHKVEEENTELRRDKLLLVDHVSDLQKQIANCESEIAVLRSKNRELEMLGKDLKHLKRLEASIQSTKWEEFSKLADNMKTLSKSMAATSHMSSS